MTKYKNERSEVYCSNRWRVSLIRSDRGWMWIVLRNKIGNLALPGDQIRHLNWWWVKGGEEPDRGKALVSAVAAARLAFWQLRAEGRI